MNIYVKAYLDKNLGDDLMLIQLIRNTHIKDKLFVHCEAGNLEFYQKLLTEYPQVTLVDCPLRKIPQKYGTKFFSWILQIGGSVLMGNSYKGCWYRTLNYFLIRRLQNAGAKYGIIGCNVGPYKNSITRFFVKLEISSTNFMTVRDQFSFNFIKRENSSKKQVYIFPDILVEAADDFQVEHINDKRKKCLGVSVHGPSSQILNQRLSQICSDYIRCTDGNILLLCFHAGKQDDEKAAYMVYSKIPIELRQNVEIIRHSTDYLNLLKKIGYCTEILAIRFHAAILAISQNIPFMAVAYNCKMSNYLNDIGVKGLGLEEFTSIDSKELVYKLLNDPIIPDDQWKLNSNQHFEILRRELDG
jgi:polysaccharide pyruvyl transferase WcaK-like protein